MKKILVLGGTNFVGRNIVEKLIADKSLDLCLFNRNKTNKDLFPQLRKISGDRETKDIKKVADENWDTVIDVSGYYPGTIDSLLNLISGKTKKYIFISTASVYDFDKFNNSPLRESDAVVECSNEERTDTTMLTYGKRKIACEDHLREHSDNINYTILRPSIIYGKYDYTDRLYYWIYRIKNCPEILVPEGGNFLLNLSFIDDISAGIEFLISHETKNAVYNISTHPVIPFHELLSDIQSILGKDPVYHTISKEDIESNQLSFPLYHGNLLQLDHSKIKNELHFHFTDLRESLEKTIQYYAAQNFTVPKVGISKEEEQKIIQQLT